MTVSDSLPLPARLVFKFLAALCSLVYELVLAQTLSVFFSNTVLRYSLTIGLYLLFMGAGAFAAGRVVSGVAGKLWRIEMVLTFTGMLAVPLLFLLDGAGVPGVGIFLLSHLLIVGIGFLTGLELPLVLAGGGSLPASGRNMVLSADYLGALAGSLGFVFYFFPYWGLSGAAGFAAVLNALAAGLLVVYNRGRSDFPRGARLITVVCLVLALGMLFMSGDIQQWCVKGYLR